MNFDNKIYFPLFPPVNNIEILFGTISAVVKIKFEMVVYLNIKYWIKETLILLDVEQLIGDMF